VIFLDKRRITNPPEPFKKNSPKRQSRQKAVTQSYGSKAEKAMTAELPKVKGLQKPSGKLPEA